MKLRTFFGFLLSFFVLTSCIASTTDTQDHKQRIADGHTITSSAMPAVKLEFDKAFKYVGEQSFVLYDVANAEQYFFVDADKTGKIKRMYWVQFEGYLPSNSHAYNYKSPKVVNIDGLDFFADVAARNIAGNQGRPDSDANRGREFLKSKGFSMASDDVLWQRLVHIPDKEKRNELMIIYLEDLSGTGLTAADLNNGGKAESQWPAMADALLERARKGFKISK